MRFEHAAAGIDASLSSPEVWRDPTPLYTRLRQAEGLALCHQPGPMIPRAWAAARYADVSAVLKDSEHFRNDSRSVRGGKSLYDSLLVPKVMRAFMRSMVFVDGEDHKRLRRLVSHAFTPARIHELERRVVTLSEELLHAATRKRSFDFMAEFALPLPLRVISEMLGIGGPESEEFHARVQTTMNPGGTWKMIRSSGAMFGLYRFFKRLIARKRRAPADDLTSALIAAEDEGDRLSPEELLGSIFLLLFAGHETTVNLLGTGTMLLLRHPEQLERLRAQPELIPDGVEEMLRISGPTQVATVRHVVEAVELGGHALQRGDAVIPVIAAANFDEATFAQPERFDVGRSPNPHLAFGGGPHFCLGAHLSRLESRVAFEQLVGELGELELACAPDELPWCSWRGGLRGLDRLPLRMRG